MHATWCHDAVAMSCTASAPSALCLRPWGWRGAGVMATPREGRSPVRTASAMATPTAGPSIGSGCVRAGSGWLRQLWCTSMLLIARGHSTGLCVAVWPWLAVAVAVAVAVHVWLWFLVVPVWLWLWLWLDGRVLCAVSLCRYGCGFGWMAVCAGGDTGTCCVFHRLNASYRPVLMLTTFAPLLVTVLSE